MTEVFGHGEQRDGLQRGGHRIAGLHRAGQHHAVDGRADGGLGEVGLVGAQGGLGLHHRGACGGLGGHGPVQCGLGGVQVGGGGHLATRQATHFLQALQGHARFLHRGLGLQHRGPGALQRALRELDLVLELGAVQFHHHLALAHAVVHVHQHLGHGAGEFAADVDRAGGLQRAIGRDVQGQIAARQGLGDVARCLLGGAVARPGQPAADQQHQHAGDQPGARALPEWTLVALQPGGQRGGFGRGGGSVGHGSFRKRAPSGLPEGGAGGGAARSSGDQPPPSDL